MNKILRTKASVILSAGILTLVSACGGSSGGNSGDANGGNGLVDTGGSNTIVSNDFAFPAIGAANGMLTEIPSGPKPAFPARRTVSKGNGSTVEFGDPVVLSYNMYSWNTGELVESTGQFDEPLTVRAGINEGIPDYLSNSLLGRNIGDKMQIIFQPGMEGLPSYLDHTDAYVIVLDLI